MKKDQSDLLLSRRQMLKLTAAAATLAACSRIPGTNAISDQPAAGTKATAVAPTPTSPPSAPSLPRTAATPSARNISGAPNAPSALAWLVANRLTFGPRAGDTDYIEKVGADAWIEEQLALKPSADDGVAKLKNLDAQFKTLTMKPGELVTAVDLERSMNRREVVGELQGATLLRAIYGRRQLHELMVDFWSNHFNIYAVKGVSYALKPTDDRDVIRANALGNFRELLGASAHSPAMLFYLDNQASRKAHPDENYARELMELHTVGVDGGYSQKDVQELARVLTGWNLRRLREGGMMAMADNDPGEFYFDRRIHDDGPATVMGLNIPAGVGEKGGEMALDMLAAHPRTATQISTKLARRFVSDTPPASVIQTGANAFTKSKGDIKATLGAILHSDEFKRSFGQKLKRPYEFAVSALRALDADVDITPQLLNNVNALGQPLFLWGPPDGYPDVKQAWASTNLTLARWNFAVALASSNLRGARVDTAKLARAGGDAVDALSIQLIGARLPQSARDALKPFENFLPALTALLIASPLNQFRS